jgi:hypothetical protein
MTTKEIYDTYLAPILHEILHPEYTHEYHIDDLDQFEYVSLTLKSNSNNPIGFIELSKIDITTDHTVLPSLIKNLAIYPPSILNSIDIRTALTHKFHTHQRSSYLSQQKHKGTK